VLAQGLRVPDDLPGGRMSPPSHATAGAVAFTAEQRAAIEDRDGSALLAANAGSGKTAVMAERCVEAVLQDGVPVGSILALTFTEKAAGELRDRIRRRFIALGEEEHARAVDAGWIGTIHGFCARVLRSRPLAAGLDPRFEVLDEGAAERLAARRLRPRLRGRGWGTRRGWGGTPANSLREAAAAAVLYSNVRPRAPSGPGLLR
jgi:ATP-dependent exoDNAse (exonuclease V) beta subunit